MNRRSFLSSCLALAAAPAIVRADSLMRIVPRDRLIHTVIGADGYQIITATFDGAGSRLVMPLVTELMVFDRAMTAEERAIVTAYLERSGPLSDVPPPKLHYIAPTIGDTLPIESWTFGND